MVKDKMINKEKLNGMRGMQGTGTLGHSLIPNPEFVNAIYRCKGCEQSSRMVLNKTYSLLLNL
jgi:hypothetical protein